MPPIEPSADTRGWAKAWRQMYVALRNEGFGQAEAIQIIAVTIGLSDGDDQ